jgi:hypothetical protein
MSCVTWMRNCRFDGLDGLPRIRPLFHALHAKRGKTNSKKPDHFRQNVSLK